MRPALAVSFVLAAICHALLLFCLHLRVLAKPLAMSDEGAPVLVTLVQPAAETPSAPPAAAASPEPSPVPAPPAPEPTPEPTPEIAPPSPTPEPETTPVVPNEETMSTPAPLPRHHEKPKPHTAVAHSSPQKAAAASRESSALPGGALHGGSSSISRPGYRYNPRPDYPAEARAAHQEGVVVLGVAVGADGRTSAVSLVKSSGYPLLDQAATEAVRRWTFDPAREGGFPVASRVDVPVRFTLNDVSR